MTTKTKDSEAPPLNIPDLKSIKGKKSRSRGAGIPWWPVASAGQGLTFGAVLGCKLGMLLLWGAVVAGAIGYGRAQAPMIQSFKSEQRAKALAAIKKKATKLVYEGDLSQLPGSRRSGDSVGMVSGTLGGKTAAQIAAEEAAEAKARADAATAAAAAADAAVGDAPLDSEIPTVADVDAASGMGGPGMGGDASAQAAMSGAKKFGELSKTLGSGLNGGAGMAGGFARGFDSPKFKDPKNDPASMGKALAMRGDAKTGRLSSRLPSANMRGGTAKRQLARAFKMSNLARGGPNESRSTLANQAFDSKSDGSSIEGAGAGTGEIVKGPSSSEPPSAPNTGGPTGTGGEMKNCPDGSTAAVCPDSQAGHSVDPVDAMVDIAKVLVMVLGGLMIIQAALTLLEWSVWTEAVKEAVNVAIMALGIGLAAIGIAMMTMDRPVQGGIYTAMGALAAALAWPGNPLGASPWIMLGTGALTAVMPSLTGNLDPKSKGDWD